MEDAFEVQRFPDLTAFTSNRGGHAKLRICIATDEILGPVRNGGVASTYFSLARLLVNDGHDVTICYLKGLSSDGEDIDHWIKHYSSLSIKLVPLYMGPAKVEATHHFWQTRYFNFYNWLKDQPPFDIVHASEWRGGPYYALLAKHLGLAFEDTLFFVKASSPHIWNRHYMMRFLDQPGLLAVMYAEQRCIELADIVIGGSAHLLSFMGHVGYKIPDDGVYVQPNVADFSTDVIDLRGEGLQPGQTLPVKEIVFFGRLEARKGLDIFCDALDLVGDAAKGIEKVTFMGKAGQRISSHPRLSIPEYIEERARRWPFAVAIEMDFGQPEAISYLCEKPRLAVMPSIIENSTMAVYEALAHRIPFIATNVGGTPELVASEDRDIVLTTPIASAFAAKMRSALSGGAYIARSAFDNAENTEIWRDFHRHLGERFAEVGPKGVLAAMRPLGSTKGGSSQPVSFSTCLYHTGAPDNLEEAILAILLQVGGQTDEILVVMDAAADHDDAKSVESYVASLADQIDVPCSLVSTDKIGIGEAFNEAARRAKHDILVFNRSDIHRLGETFFGQIARAFQQAPTAALSTAYRKRSTDDDGFGSIYVPMGADLASGFLDRFALGGEVIAVRANVFRDCGGFAEEQRKAGIEQELLVRLKISGQEFEVLPEPLFSLTPENSRVALNELNAQFLAMRPLFDRSSFENKRLLLFAGLAVAKEAAARPSTPKEAVARLDGAKKQPDAKAALASAPREAEWLIKQGAGNKDTEPNLLVGFDPQSRTFGFRVQPSALKGRSATLRLTLDDAEIVTKEIEPGASDSALTLWTADAVTHGKLPSKLKAQVTCDGKAIFARQITIAKGDGTIEVRSPRPISTIEELASLVEAVAPPPQAEERPLSARRRQWAVSKVPEGDAPRVQIAFSPQKEIFEIAIHESFIDSEAPALAIRFNKVDLPDLPFVKRGPFFYADFAIEAETLRFGATQLIVAVRGGRFDDLRRGLTIERPADGQKMRITTKRRVILLPGREGLQESQLITPEARPEAPLAGGWTKNWLQAVRASARKLSTMRSNSIDIK